MRAFLVMSVVASALVAGAPVRPVGAATRRRRPNILFVLTDDLDLAEMRYLPHVHGAHRRPGHDLRRLLREQLAVLPVAHHDPARASTRTTPGCETNGGDNGGFERAHANGVEQSTTVATWLHRAGYTHRRSSGKYLNGYPNGVPTRPTSRPGWDEFGPARSTGTRTRSTTTC